MKYTCTIEIEAAIDKVASLWSNEQYFKEWQDGFIEIEHLSGEKDMVGAKSKIILKQGNRKIELLETIVSNNLPKEKIGLYEHVHMTNTQTTRFEVINEHLTKYTSEVHYLKFNGFIPKFMARYFPRMFKKQSEKWMRQFKEFAEGFQDREPTIDK